MMLTLRERATGRWKDILRSLGIESKYLQNKHGPCPVCGGKDRFRWDNKNGEGTFYCTSCGAGDGVKLVMLKHGCGFSQARAQIERVIGGAKRQEIEPALTQEQCMARIRRAWSRTKPASGTPVAMYLQRRGIFLPMSKVIRSSVDRPAMVAIMQAPNDKATMAHITLLTEDGNKAPAEKTKLFMKGTIAKGSAVRLAEHGEELAIAEGIETALSVTMLTGVPCWAALNEGLLAQWEPPAGVRSVAIYGDNDLNFVGQSAAYALARRLSVRRDPVPHVEVCIPNEPGDDWNDVLIKKSVN